MQAKAAEYKRARELRAEGMSIKRIARELGVAVSSVSVWVRDVPVPPPPPPEPPVLDPRVRRCGRCRRERSLSYFNRAGDGHQHWCRDCFREYFRQRGDVHRQQSGRAKMKRVDAARAVLLRRLDGACCADCGEDELAVLEFDHLGDKEAGIAELTWAGADPATLERELDKCEVVCVCCHRRRTAHRAGWARATGLPKRHWTVARRRNHAYVMEALANGCVDCGERDPVVLDFDHVDVKLAKIAALMGWASLERLKAEVGRCEIRCCNCHRLATLARRGGGWRGAPEWAAGVG